MKHIDWPGHIKRQKESDVSIKKYCFSQGIPEWKFYDARRKIQKKYGDFIRIPVEQTAKTGDRKLEIRIDQNIGITFNSGIPEDNIFPILSALLRSLP